jgi:hypothetical protein
MSFDDGVDSQLMNCVVRMVVPLRREFGRELDVGVFLRDVRYAREVLLQALQSRDPRLVDYARTVDRRMHGPRPAARPPLTKPSGALPGTPAEPAAPDTRQSAEDHSRAEELRAQVMKKYTGGLR